MEWKKVVECMIENNNQQFKQFQSLSWNDNNSGGLMRNNNIIIIVDWWEIII